MTVHQAALEALGDHDYLIARQSAGDLPEQVDLDAVAAAYDGYFEDPHYQLTPPSSH